MDRAYSTATSDVATLTRLRRFLLLTLIAGTAGMVLELAFIGHFEDPLQLVPVVLLAVGLVSLTWHAAWPRRASMRTVQLLMTLFVVSGLAGVGLHYRGNHEFEREMYPSMAGVELVGKTLTGATPVLAPGSMALLGLVGLAAVYKSYPGPRRGSAITVEDAS
jgi:hypothetical protein